MPDWLQTLAAIIVTAIIAPILVKRFAPAWQRRKVEAEADSEQAETIAAFTAAWKELLTATQEQLEIAEAGLTLRGEELLGKDAEIADLKEETALLYEQKVAVMAHNTALTARLATARGVDVVNHEAEQAK